MSDQPEKNRTSRDAELEALRQKSLVGTQRASLGSGMWCRGTKEYSSHFFWFCFCFCFLLLMFFSCNYSHIAGRDDIG